MSSSVVHAFYASVALHAHTLSLSSLSLSLSSLSLSTDTHASFSLSKTPGQISIALRWFEWFLSVFLRCFASLLLQLSANVRCVWFLRFEVIDLIASTAKLGSFSFMWTTHLLFFHLGWGKGWFFGSGVLFFYYPLVFPLCESWNFVHGYVWTLGNFSVW